LIHSGRLPRFVAGVLAAVLAAPGLVLVGAAPAKAAGPGPGFVTRIGTNLLLDGRPFVFTGLDIYNANSDGWCGAEMDSGSQLDDALTALGPGRNVIRSWFFQPLTINKGTRLRSWAAFDHTLQVAAAHGFKVIATLTDQWGECGTDTAGNGYKEADWYVNGYKAVQPGMINSYRDYVAEVVARYKDNPTIAFWQLINEAEVTPCPAGDLTPYQKLHDWAADVSGLVKSLDSNHLVSLGTIGSGQCGADGPRYQTLHAIPTIDLCEFHDYGAPLVGIPGDQYNGLQLRIDQCNALDKPIFTGEAGIIPNDIGGTFQARADAFRAKIDAQLGAGVRGFLAWAWSPVIPPASTLDSYDIGPGDPALTVLGRPTAAATERASVDSSGGQANGPSTEFVGALALSADGRSVAFESAATNLVPGDTNGASDIFVRDRVTGTTRRVSVDGAGVQADNVSQQVAISGDGRFVAFSSNAANLVTGDTNGVSDVFVHDMSTGATERVSVDSAGAEAVGGTSWQPAISADGQFVTFASAATNLEPGNPGGDFHIYVHDRTTGSTVRVSVNDAGDPSNGSSGGPNLSADGRFVTFASAGDNLVAGDTNGTYDVFVRDLQAGTTERVSVDGAGGEGDASSGHSSISGDGRYVVFDSSASNLVSGDLNGAVDVFVHDRQTGTTERDSVTGAGSEASSDSASSAISGDGRSVVFESFAGNLVPGDTNGAKEVFLHDRQSGVTERLALDDCGSQGNSVSFEAHVSADGSAVAFGSYASNLIAGDTNGVYDAFVRTRNPDQPQTGTCPGAPDAVSAAAGDGQASVSWSAPASDGGNAVIGYTIQGTSTAGNVAATVDGTVTSTTVGPLANGSAYTFTVTATNAIGSGAASAPSGAVTPQAGAAPPQTTSETIPTSGGTASTDPGGGPTASDPLTTSVAVPATAGGGSVTIAETAVTETAPVGGYQFLGQQVDITSTAATSSNNPLTIVFTMYPSVLLAATGMPAPPPESVDVTRAEAGSPVVILVCTATTPSIAPDPCVSNRQYIGANLQITILTGTASHWNTAVRPTAESVSNTGYSPKTVTVSQAGIVLWTFAGTKPHSVTDSLKLGPAKAPLFDSGAITSGRYGYAFQAAGTYTYRSTVKGDSGAFAGTVAVPLRISPTTGGTATSYAVTWSSSALSGYVFDVQYRFKKAGAKTWSAYKTWQNGTALASGAFTPPSGLGTYAFSARLRNRTTGLASQWSPELAITVH
jgi:plastocyanin